MERLIKELDENLRILETKYDNEIVELHAEYEKNICMSEMRSSFRTGTFAPHYICVGLADPKSQG